MRQVFYIIFCFQIGLCGCAYDDTRPCACLRPIFVKSKAESIMVRPFSNGCGFGSGKISMIDSNLYKIECPSLSAFSCPTMFLSIQKNGTRDTIILDSIEYQAVECKNYQKFHFSINGNSYENDTIVFP